MYEKTLKNPDFDSKMGTIRPEYSVFALIYDQVMRNVPYQRWARYLLNFVTEFRGAIPGQVLELGCGTATLLEYLGEGIIRQGGGNISLRGLDISEDMLAIARRRLPRGRFTPGRLEGPLPFKDAAFPWVVCAHDSVNYLVDPALLQAHFREIYRILAPGGLYSLDVVSLQNILGNYDRRSKVFRVGPYRLHWSNHYDRDSFLLTSELRFINRNSSGPSHHPGKGPEKNGQTGRNGKNAKSAKNIRVETEELETHTQRYYSAKEIVQAATAAGLSLLTREGDYRERAPRESDPLLNFHFTRKD